MNESGLFTASILDSSARAFAAGAVARMTDIQGQSSLLDYWNFGEVVADTELRVRNLAEALAVGRPEVFQLDVDWLAATFTARGVPSEIVRTTLMSLRAELLESLPDSSRDMVETYVDRALASVGRAAPIDQSVLESESAQAELSQRFLLAALEGRRSDAEGLVQAALADGLGIPELHLQVIAKAQIEIGRMWQAGEVSIAEEHLGSRIVEDVMAYLRSRMPLAPENGRRVVVASVSGNLHDIGARMVADHFEMAGWSSLFLGADTPAEDLAGVLSEFSPRLVALSVGMGLNLRTTARMIETLRAKVSGIPILVGGRPFALVPELWKDVGADGWAADAPGAVAEANRLVREAV